jgi:hypothetical protein
MAAELPNPSLVPFVVAVTGHRDLRPPDEAPLRCEVGNILAGLRSRMSSTPLLVMSGLAEGADQLAAEVALEQGAFLAAVLPMPLEVYKTTMSEEAQLRLDKLRAQAAIEIVLPVEGQTDEQLRDSEESRAACYEALALFLARQGQALIALWDGKHSDRRGGTSRVVHYVRTGAPQESTLSLGAHCGVVYHVVTPRSKGEPPPNALTTLTLGCETKPSVTQGGTIQGDAIQRDARPPEGEAAGTSPALLEENLERFNRAALRLPDAAVKPRSRLLEDGSVVLSAFQQRLETLYGVADAISVRANGWRKLFLTMILVVAIVGTLFYGIHGEMLESNAYNVWLWFSFPLFVITALVLHRAAGARHIEAQYLDGRAFAEALRVQFFWDLAGVKRSVGMYYLADQPNELDWIRHALKNVWLLGEGTQGEANANAAAPNRPAVLKFWVIDQRDWYRRKAKRQLKSVRRRERVSRNALLIAVGWSILIPAIILIHTPWWHIPGPVHETSGASASSNWLYEALHVLLAVPALIAGAYRLWIEQAGYEEQSREYRSMERELTLKATALEANLNSPDAAQELLLQLGVAALSENGRWLLLHRERPLEVMATP